MAGSGSSSSRTRRRRVSSAAVAPDDVGASDRVAAEPDVVDATVDVAVDLAVDLAEASDPTDGSAPQDTDHGSDERNGAALGLDDEEPSDTGSTDTPAADTAPAAADSEPAVDAAVSKPVEFDASALLDELGPAPLFDVGAYGADDDLFPDRHEDVAAAVGTSSTDVMWPRVHDDRIDVVPLVAVAEPAAVEPALVVAEPAVAVPSSAPPLVVPSRAQRLAARRLQARRVGRIVWHIDLWSLLKVAVLFWLCAIVVVVLALVALWSVLQRSGVVGNVEQFVVDAFALETFSFDGPLMFRLVVVGGLALAAAAALLTVVLGLMFNLISDLVGGIRLTVVEEESARPVRPRRR